MFLEIVLAVEFNLVLLKNKFKDSSEGLGGDRGVFPVKSLVCFACCEALSREIFLHT